MKIIGLTYIKNSYVITLKSDSSLLNQRKPFFLPEHLGDIYASKCIVARVCRLGKNIQTKYASRYFDGFALGLNFRSEELIKEGKMTEAVAFDNSLAVGQWKSLQEFPTELLPVNPSLEDALAAVSRIMTLRIGDIIYVDTAPAQKVIQEQIYTLYINEEENLYCKIK